MFCECEIRAGLPTRGRLGTEHGVSLPGLRLLSTVQLPNDCLPTTATSLRLTTPIWSVPGETGKKEMCSLSR